jgi:hypothetical protein
MLDMSNVFHRRSTNSKLQTLAPDVLSVAFGGFHFSSASTKYPANPTLPILKRTDLRRVPKTRVIHDATNSGFQKYLECICCGGLNFQLDCSIKLQGTFQSNVYGCFFMIKVVQGKCVMQRRFFIEIGKGGGLEYYRSINLRFW